MLKLREVYVEGTAISFHIFIFCEEVECVERFIIIKCSLKILAEIFYSVGIFTFFAREEYQGS